MKNKCNRACSDDDCIIRSSGVLGLKVITDAMAAAQLCTIGISTEARADLFSVVWFGVVSPC